MHRHGDTEENNKEKWGVEKIFYFPFSLSLHLLPFSLIFFVFVSLCASVSQWFNQVFVHLYLA
ncbi:MAG: hypothetical protein A2Z59_04140 [Nitrospinae bacterium RIFCSPLOWO2_02_39_17]|nr:MAG: hypothetical protein A2Z59_04140 [Nitrospinae bacterium RIFCSPLOWO2_02_39_17]